MLGCQAEMMTMGRSRSDGLARALSAFILSPNSSSRVSISLSLDSSLASISFFSFACVSFSLFILISVSSNLNSISLNLNCSFSTKFSKTSNSVFGGDVASAPALVRLRRRVGMRIRSSIFAQHRQRTVSEDNGAKCFHSGNHIADLTMTSVVCGHLPLS